MAVKDLVARAKRSHPYRAWSRYGDANGDLLAAGVGYFAFFSVFPALALAFTVFGFVLRGRPELLDSIAESLNTTLPNMVKTADNPTGIIGLSAPESATLTITGVVSFVTLVLSGLGWMGALRAGIRGVFGLEGATGNAVVAKLRDLGVLAALGLGVAVSAVLTSGVGALTKHLAAWVGLGGNEVLITVAGLLVGVVFDTFLMVVLLRLLSGVPLPWANVRNGAIFGAVLLTAMKFFGGLLIERATANPLLGTVAVAVGLLFWLNLMSRVVLLSAAWAANDLDVAALTEHPAEAASSEPAPAAQTTDEGYAAGLAPAPPVPTARGAFAAGALIGAAATALVESLRRRPGDSGDSGDS